MKNKQLIGKDRVVLNAQKKKRQRSYSQHGFEITEIISNETKTKVGKDFADLYFISIMSIKLMCQEKIVLTEEFSFGSSR
jgi:hypothetical protein